MRDNKLPSSACQWDYSGTSIIRARIGVPGVKLPKTMHGEWTIDGWRVVVKRGSAPKPGKARTAKARIFVRVDGRLVPAGRVRAALCRTKLHRSRKQAAKRRGAKGRFTERAYGPRSGLAASGCVAVQKTIKQRNGRTKTFMTMVGDGCPKKRKPSARHLRPYQYKSKR